MFFLTEDIPRVIKFLTELWTFGISFISFMSLFIAWELNWMTFTGPFQLNRFYDSIKKYLTLSAIFISQRHKFKTKFIFVLLLNPLINFFSTVFNGSPNRCAFCFIL